MKATFGLLFLLTLFAPCSLHAQLLSVTGYVKNAITGEAIENATIYESISGIGTITNSDGYYRLLLNRGKQNLRISGTNYEMFSATFKMNTDTIISANLISLTLPVKRVVTNSKPLKDLSEQVIREKP